MGARPECSAEIRGPGRRSDRRWSGCAGAREHALGGPGEDRYGVRPQRFPGREQQRKSGRAALSAAGPRSAARSVPRRSHPRRGPLLGILTREGALGPGGTRPEPRLLHGAEIVCAKGPLIRAEPAQAHDAGRVARLQRESDGAEDVAGQHDADDPLARPARWPRTTVRERESRRRACRTCAPGSGSFPRSHRPRRQDSTTVPSPPPQQRYARAGERRLTAVMPGTDSNDSLLPALQTPGHNQGGTS